MSQRLYFDPGVRMKGGIAAPALILAFNRSWLIPKISATS